MITLQTPESQRQHGVDDPQGNHDLDRRGADWKKFHDINFVDHMPKPLDASGWNLKPSGRLGPVSLTPCRVVTDGELP